MKLNKPIIFNGKGDSLWGNSVGDFQVDQINLEYFSKDKTFGEIQMFGPNTEWFQYTDSRIKRQANRPEVMAYVRKLLTKVRADLSKKWRICWSEQGMQPEKGWSFDLYSE